MSRLSHPREDWVRAACLVCLLLCAAHQDASAYKFYESNREDWVDGGWVDSGVFGCNAERDNGTYAATINTLDFTSGSAEDAALKSALNEWNGIPGSALSATYSNGECARDGYDQVNCVSWDVDDIIGEGALAAARVWRIYTFLDPPSNTQRAPCTIPDADILIDTDRVWEYGLALASDYAPPLNLKTTITHEFGHAIGLKHPIDKISIMGLYSIPGASGPFGYDPNNVIDIHADDMAAMRVLYPAGSTGNDVAILPWAFSHTQDDYPVVRRVTKGVAPPDDLDEYIVDRGDGGVQLEYSIENRGTSSATFDVGFYIFQDSAWRLLDANIGATRASGVAATDTRVLIMPLDIPPAYYTFKVAVDPNDDIAEFDETNNEMKVPGQIYINVNSAPAVTVKRDGTPVTAVAIPWGEPITLVSSADDINDDPITGYSASSLPSGADFDSVSRTFAWTPTSGQKAATYNVTFTASDGYLTGERVVAITVLDLGPPVSLSPSHVAADSITTAWGDDGNPPSTQYLVVRAMDAGFTSGVGNSGFITTATHAFGGLAANVRYFFRVKARDPNIGVDTSTVSLPATYTLSHAPAAGAVGPVSEDAIAVSWGAAGNPAGTEFRAERAADAGFTSGQDYSAWDSTTSHAFSGLSPNTTYYLRVRSRNGDSVESTPTSSPATVTLARMPASAAPTGISSGSVAATWGANGNPAGTFYLAERATDAGFTTQTAAVGVDVTSATFTGLTPNTTYYFRAAALSHGNVPTQGAELPPALTYAAPPAGAEPTLVSDTQLTAVWGMGGNPAGTEFYVELAENSGFTAGARDSGWVAKSSHPFHGLTLDTLYYTRVKARNAAEVETAYTNLTSTRTLPFAATFPPQGILLSPASPTSLDATWSLLSPPEAPLYVFSAAEDFSTTIASQTGAAGQESVSFGSLSPNTTYYFKIKVSTANDVFYSDVHSMPTWANAPVAAAASDVAVTSIRAEWTAAGNPAGTQYISERALDAGFAGGAADSGWTTETSFDASGLDPNTTYYFRVRARNHAAIETSLVELPTQATLAKTPSSAPPAGVYSSSITVAWGLNGNPAGTQALLWKALDAGFTSGSGDSGWVTGTQHTFTGLTPATTYHFRVRARNHGGVETQDAALPETVALAAAPGSSGLSDVTSESITANWTSSGNGPAARYLVERTTAASFMAGLADSGWITGTSLPFGGLDIDRRYYFRVKARNPAGQETGWTALPSAATLALPPAGAEPSGIGPTAATANWGANGNAPETLYYVERSTEEDFGGNIVGAGWFPALGHNFTGLTPNTTYYFRVRARNVDAVATSATVLPSARTPVAPPSSGGSPGIASEAIMAVWDGGGNPEGTEYSIERATDAAFTGGLADSGWIMDTSHTFYDLDANTTYYLRVKARDAEHNESTASELPPVVTLANPPVSLSPSGISETSITANWSAADNPDGTLFLAERAADAGFTQGVNQSGWITAASHAFTSLASNTRYYFRVRARNSAQVETATAVPTDAVTLAAQPASAAPSSVFDVSVVANWGANGNALDTQYYVERHKTGTPSDAAASGWITGTAFAFTGLTPETGYDFCVKARNREGVDTAFTDLPSTSTVKEVPVPRDVSFLSADPTSLTLGWTLLAPTEVPVHALAQDRFFTTGVSLRTGSAGQESGTFSGLTPNTTYYFRVKLSTVTDEYYSVPVATATPAVAPSAPSADGLATDALTARWEANGNSPHTDYLVETDDDPSFASVNASSVTRNLSATVSGLSPNTRYYLRVRALHHSGGTTAPPSALALATLADAPTAAAGPFVAVTFSSITARWTPLPASPPSASAEGYVLEAFQAADFSGAVSSASVAGAAGSLSVGGLRPGGTYYVRVGSLNLDDDPNYLVLGSTSTFYATATDETVPTNSEPMSVSVAPAYPEIVSVSLEVPANALPAGTTLTIDTGVRFSLPPPVSSQARLTPLGADVGIDISAGGRQPKGLVTITMVYDPAMLPASADPRRLVIARYREDAGEWTVLPSRVDTGGSKITALTDHFSLFAPFLSVAAASLDAVQIFPVPWEPGSGTRFDAPWLTFSNLPAGSRVEIFTILGEALWSADDPGNTVLTWDGRSGNGVRAASGTYLAVIKDGGSRIVRRVVVIR
ncbi:MAG: fibronectin type III domain-containing protein [Elusimicrobiota bacterium]